LRLTLCTRVSVLLRSLKPLKRLSSFHASIAPHSLSWLGCS
jgi:hypothetical protein